MASLFVERSASARPDCPTGRARAPCSRGEMPLRRRCRASRLAPAALPATERRRANDASRWALEAAGDAVRDLAPERRGGARDGVRVGRRRWRGARAPMLRDLAQRQGDAVADDLPQLGVQRAGRLLVARRAGAGARRRRSARPRRSFAAGPARGRDAGDRSRAAPVLLVAYDLPFPAGCADRHAARVPRSPARCCSRASPPSAAGLRPHWTASRRDGRGRRRSQTARRRWMPRSRATRPRCALPLLSAVARGMPARVPLP